MSNRDPNTPLSPRTPRRRPFSPVAPRSVHRSPGTPRKHTAPRSTRLRGIKEWKFTLEETRQQVIQKLKLTYVPDDWQIHLIIRILRGFDSIFLAGTGYGKSLIFEAVAALGGKKKVTIVVCPLKALEADQVKQATEKGIDAILINEDNTKDITVWKRAEKSAQLVYISPEMALSDQFGRLWTNQKFKDRVNALITDEAHCIDDWGEEFRPVYRQLHRLRNFTGQEVPFVACTATCATRTFNIIWTALGFGHRPFWGVDAGSDRANLFFRMRTLTNMKDPILDVLDLLPKDLNDTSNVSLVPKILTYHASEAACAKAKATWRRALPPHLRDCVYAYSSGISEEAKKECWEGFMSGRYRILCATDAAGMGCNVPDVEYSIVFECPRSLSVLVQRWGRAGRSRQGIGTCLFFVQPWAFRPAPPEVGLAVQRVRGEDKLVIELKSHTTSRDDEKGASATQSNPSAIKVRAIGDLSRFPNLSPAPLPVMFEQASEFSPSEIKAYRNFAFTDTLSNPGNDPFFSVDNAAFWISSLVYQLYLLHHDFVTSSTRWCPEDASPKQPIAYRTYILVDKYIGYPFFSLKNPDIWINPIAFQAYMDSTQDPVLRHSTPATSHAPSRATSSISMAESRASSCV
ncbi:P-loop containing nucleoside triphosphate hydrolase protein [Mycena rebaudengoi]|nr:P-loop containing nucleoside triphosphate hydrolase protein [Mycena rebaudengoi]